MMPTRQSARLRKKAKLEPGGKDQASAGKSANDSDDEISVVYETKPAHPTINSTATQPIDGKNVRKPGSGTAVENTPKVAKNTNEKKTGKITDWFGSSVMSTAISTVKKPTTKEKKKSKPATMKVVLFDKKSSDGESNVVVVPMKPAPRKRNVPQKTGLEDAKLTDLFKLGPVSSSSTNSKPVPVKSIGHKRKHDSDDEDVEITLSESTSSKNSALESSDVADDYESESGTCNYTYNEATKTWDCNFCNRPFKSKIGAGVHSGQWCQKALKKKKKSPTSGLESSGVTDGYTCYSYNEATGLWECKYCDKTSGSKSGIGVHVVMGCEKAPKNVKDLLRLSKNMRYSDKRKQVKLIGSKKSGLESIGKVLGYTCYSYNKATKLWECNYCPMTSGSALGIGLHVGRWCEKAPKDKKKLLKADRLKRYKMTPGGRAKARMWNKSPKGRAWKNSPRGRAYMRGWRKTAIGRISQRRSKIRHFKKYPHKYKQFIQKCHLLGIVSHRTRKAKRRNEEFPSIASNDFTDTRAQWLIDFEVFTKLHADHIPSLLGRIDAFYSSSDSIANNFVYFYLDATLWSDDMSLEDFLRAIFYIGRGVECRFQDHARDTQLMLKDNVEIDGEKWPKEARIASIWEQNSPVKIVLLDLDKYAEMTDFIEFATTFTLGLDRLTNKRYDGAASVPLGFTYDDVFAIGNHYIREAFNKRGEAYNLWRDDDYGPKRAFKD